MKSLSTFICLLFIASGIAVAQPTVDITKVKADPNTQVFDDGKHTVNSYIYSTLESATSCCGNDAIYLEVKIDGNGKVSSAKTLTGKNDCYRKSVVDIVKTVTWISEGIRDSRTIYFEVKPIIPCSGSPNENQYKPLDLGAVASAGDNSGSSGGDDVFGDDSGSGNTGSSSTSGSGDDTGAGNDTGSGAVADTGGDDSGSGNDTGSGSGGVEDESFLTEEGGDDAGSGSDTGSGNDTGAVADAGGDDSGAGDDSGSGSTGDDWASSGSDTGSTGDDSGSGNDSGDSWASSGSDSGSSSSSGSDTGSSGSSSSSSSSSASSGSTSSGSMKISNRKSTPGDKFTGDNATVSIPPQAKKNYVAKDYEPNEAHKETFVNVHPGKNPEAKYVDETSAALEIKKELRKQGYCGIAKAWAELIVTPNGQIVSHQIMEVNSDKVAQLLPDIMNKLKFEPKAGQRYNYPVYIQFKTDIVCEGKKPANLDSEPYYLNTEGISRN